MKSKQRSWILPDREITAEDRYLDRRQIIKGLALAGLLPACSTTRHNSLFLAPTGTYPAASNPAYQVPERALTDELAATSYNNFYEFSLKKDGVKDKVGDFVTNPWKVEIAGLVEKKGEADLEDFFRHLPSEERIYRFRCVEAWAMTVPWTGFPIKSFLEWVKPEPAARYMRMLTFMRPDQAPNQAPDANSGYSFPYYEGLSLEEAGNELSLFAHGIYGKELPPQNGAPLRLVVPWKYGLKNIKSIVRIEFTRERPSTFWNDLKPQEYSWHSNVEPQVPHPRWSQASERLIPDGERVDTLPYNGYADHVAQLYAD
ncbi:MAG: protein-methionine-sulfoxide reductase catalytic subunit MsrP [Planctomycetota bacterium]|jgi:sulfoxide reductase catalytic subunit YedY